MHQIGAVRGELIFLVADGPGNLAAFADEGANRNRVIAACCGHAAFRCQ
jgi:hypothetical protein